MTNIMSILDTIWAVTTPLERNVLHDCLHFPCRPKQCSHVVDRFGWVRALWHSLLPISAVRGHHPPSILRGDRHHWLVELDTH